MTVAESTRLAVVISAAKIAAGLRGCHGRCLFFSPPPREVYLKRVPSAEQNRRI